MSYHFTFDLSGISQTLFHEIAKLSNRRNAKISDIASDLVSRFQVAEKTGLRLEDAVMLIKDMIDTHFNNFLSKPLFKVAKNKALLLPHCCRKYMDSRCKATFNSEVSSYECNFCSKDCLVYQATKLANKKKYDVFILPGGSCVRKILEKKSYDGVVGIACTDELKLGTKILCSLNTPALSIPLTKNGCSKTQFNFDMLKNVLDEKDNKIEENT
jgi:uncharacterized protein